MTERRSSLATSIKSELTANAKIWLTAFAAMIAYTPCAGTLTSFPVSANYLKTQMGASQETINTISSLAFGFTVGLCPVSSILFKKIGYRNVGILGVFGVGLSMGLSVFATEIWQVYLTYSFMFGFFNNCAYNGLISFVGDQFLGTSYRVNFKNIFNYYISSFLFRTIFHLTVRRECHRSIRLRNQLGNYDFQQRGNQHHVGGHH